MSHKRDYFVLSRRQNGICSLSYDDFLQIENIRGQRQTRGRLLLSFSTFFAPLNETAANLQLKSGFAFKFRPCLSESESFLFLKVLRMESSKIWKFTPIFEEEEKLIKIFYVESIFFSSPSFLFGESCLVHTEYAWKCRKFLGSNRAFRLRGKILIEEKHAEEMRSYA